MESCFYTCWIYLCMVTVLFRNSSADPLLSPHYTIHHGHVKFDQARHQCSPGVLTTVATKTEIMDILTLISKSVPSSHKKDFSAWVGLRKPRSECVNPLVPLRGFKWIEDNSTESEEIPWEKEPSQTCTGILCAAVKVMFDGSAVPRWGLSPVSCRNTNPFICKHRDRPRPPTSEPAMQRPQSTPPEPEVPIRGTEPDTNLAPTTDSKPQESDHDPDSEPALGSDRCQHPIIPSARSLSLDPDNSSTIKVECWSTTQLEIHCSGHPVVWRMIDNSPANLSTICQRCEDGFLKDATGKCVDIDECSQVGLCRHICKNVVGSYECVCADESGNHYNESSPECVDSQTKGENNLLSGLLIPVAVAVTALVVLMVVIMVTVKCCLMRRSKKRAIRREEKVAMRSNDGKDSFEKANEKAAI